MSWFNFCTENIQKRCCRYLLQRYIGRFLERKIEPDQLSINVLDGAVSLEDIVLDVQALNNVGDEHQLPFEFVKGSVDKISLSVPWRNMLKESSVIHIEGLSLTVRPNVKETEGIPSSMLESVWSSMSNSVYSSPDNDKYEESFDNAAPESEQVLGLEVFTQAIESILNRIKVKFSNTVIKLEYMPDFMKLGLGLQLHIISLDYIDEVADESKEGILYDNLAFLTKKLVIEGVFLQTYEFHCPKSNNEEPVSKTNTTEPITIAELTGIQTIRMILKHNPSLPGPKLSLEIHFGPLNVICSPRQLYLVIEILRGISKPLIEQKQNAPVQKPMSESDFNHIELDLFNHVESRHDVGLRGMQGWSNVQDDEEEFFPLQGAKNKTFVPSMNSSMTSSMSSVASSSKSDLSSRYTRHKHKSKNEWLGETNHFNVKLTSLCVVLLHEDILAVCPETDLITQCSLNEMRKISHQYLMAVQNSDIIKNCDKVTNSLEKNHLKFVAKNVFVDGDEKTNETVKDVNITASGANVVIMEVLIGTLEESTEYIPILKFVYDAKCSPLKMSNSSFDQPDIQLQFKHITKSTSYCNPVSSDIKITMQEAFSEVDISIINRLSSYIYNPDFQISKNSHMDGCQPQFHEVIESVNDASMNCTLNFNYLVIKFRFPIPDLRPLSDINRLPWWKRILRDDILWLYLTNVEGSFSKTSQQTITTGYEIQCQSIEALFQEGNTNNIIPIAKCKGVDDDLKTIRMDAKQRPKLVLKLCPVGNQDEIKDGNSNVEYNMTSSVYVESSKKPSPFASKKIMRQRNHHSDSNEQEQKLSDGEIQVVPGSREEIMDFVENTNTNSKVFLDINVPHIFVTLPSKHLYELIYNRFTNDLFFWSPSFPTPASHRGDSNRRLSHIMNRTRYFAPCKSGIQFDSESESEDEATNVYFSCEQSNLNIADPMIKRTEFCLNLNVAQGLFTIVTQSRDRSERVIPQHYGELQIVFEDLYLYMAAGYENTPRHNFICIQANKFCLSHENLSTNRRDDHMTPKEVVFRKNKSLRRVLYKIPACMDFKERTGINKSDMLTVVVEISVCNHIKTIRVANEIYGTTLRHVFSVVAQSWYYQLSDFFDVVDYPVAGYESPHVITELHQHISECLIDYRPLNLSYQCALTIGNFSLSSNIVARSKTSTLQIVSEDVAFFISAHLSEAENFDLISNYICVMDLGVFELSLKLTKGSKQSNILLQPEVDLRMGVNVIHIRTCADSAFALCRFISYLAADGDKSSVEEQTTEFEGVDQEEPVLLDQADSDNNSLSSLIMEAMHEETIGIKKPVEIIKKQNSNKSSSSTTSDKGVEVFYFPDEANKIVSPLDVQSSLQFEVDAEEDDDDFIEKEFCFIEHEAGSGLMPRSNVPEVRMLTDTQIRLVNNYFKAPVGKIDMLQAPKEYPTPVAKYTLREMTLIWHIYGGTDFGTKTTHNELTRHVTIVSETNSCPTSPNTLRPSLSRYYSQTNINSQKNPNSKKESANISQARTRFCCSILPTSWQAKGGPDRQHHVLMQLQLNKVRFQQEVYPLHTKQAMRQVILIQDFEIRDKLASSNINKFLYLYSSEAIPKQHNANMFVAKGVHMRPDSNIKAQECCIKVSMLPLKLNIDQDSLIFLISFINQFNTLSQKMKDEILSEKKMPSKSEEPIMTLGNACDGQQDITPNPLIELNDEFDEHFRQKHVPFIPKSDAGITSSDSKAPVYIRQFVFSPEVTIRLDYEGRHIDLSHGSVAGLLMGLAQLNCSEITLKRIVHKYGLLGFDKLLTYITQEWLQDIKKHQLPSLLGGVGPMYSFVRLIQGIRDLIQLPIEQYQKDGRIVRGLQRGANSFTTSTAMAALEIATRIVNLIQRVAETTYDMVNPGPSMRQLRLQESKKKNRSNNRSHPADIREGVTSALTLVKEGLGETAQTIVRVASEEHEIKGTAGMVGGVMRQIPPTAITPIILASQATCHVLRGVQCQLAPDAHAEAMQKWRCD